jgi:outer membrane biosynthesis protein TonB
MMEAKFTPSIRGGKATGSELLMTFLIGKAFEDSKKAKTPAANGTANVPKIINAGVINGRAVKLPKPEYPADARGYGLVTVHVLVDEQGNVILAGAKTGGDDITLADAARTAACKAKFSPTVLAGNPLKVSGEITYSFFPKRSP